LETGFFQPSTMAGDTMDLLTNVLDTLYLTGSLYCRADLGAPWGLHFLPASGVIFHVVYKGEGCLSLPDEANPRPLKTGDLILLTHGEEHLLLERPGAAVQRDLRPDRWAECAWMRSSESPAAMILCGTFDIEARSGHPLFNLLPRLIHLARGGSHSLDPLLDLMAREAEAEGPGKTAILRRLSEILFIQIIRLWTERQSANSGGWLGALRDPYIGRSLSLIHKNPERPWTVEALANHLALSRPAFAARFTALTGEPPLRYLLRWRMQTASRLLRSTHLSLAEIARQVGYNSEASFGKAFKRELGAAPGDYRRAAGPAG
jgi:AraC-like DNA-binding protein